nr:alpha/beta fold hydrolase [uncultured Carboxylicivirga sp.]
MKKFNQSILVLFLISIMFSCTNKPQKSTSVNGLQAETKAVEINGAVGKLKAILEIPEVENDKCPLVILMHGFMSSKNDQLITAVANELKAKGMASIRFDFDGHGESDGEFVKMTVPLEVKDALAVFEYAKTLDFVSDISLLGHSQGGVVTSLVAGELNDAVKSVVLMAPAAVLVDDAKNGTVMGVKYDPVNVPEYVDVFNHKLGREYIQSAQQLDIYGKAAGYKGVVCLIHGKADRIVPFSYSERYNETYNNSTLHLFENENHMFSVNTKQAVDTAVDFLVNQNK